jgi:hypothetical protein
VEIRSESVFKFVNLSIETLRIDPSFGMVLLRCGKAGASRAERQPVACYTRASSGHPVCPLKAFYSDHFVLPLPAGHRFPTQRYRLVREVAQAQIPDLELDDAVLLRQTGNRDARMAGLLRKLPLEIGRKVWTPLPAAGCDD